MSSLVAQGAVFWALARWPWLAGQHPPRFFLAPPASTTGEENCKSKYMIKLMGRDNDSLSEEE